MLVACLSDQSVPNALSGQCPSTQVYSSNSLSWPSIRLRNQFVQTCYVNVRRNRGLIITKSVALILWRFAMKSMKGQEMNGSSSAAVCLS